MSSEQIGTRSEVDASAASLRALRCVSVETEAGFLDLEGAWQSVEARSANRSPLITWPWLRVWWEVIGRRCPRSGHEGHVYVVTVLEDEDVVAIYPFVEHRSRNPLALRRLRPMCYAGFLEVGGLSEEPVVVVARGYEASARAALIEHLAAQIQAGRWDWTIIRQVSKAQDLVRCAPCPGVYVRERQKPGPKSAAFPGTWKEFRKGLTKSMRDNLPYYPRLLQRDGHIYEVGICDRPEEMATAAKTLVELHKRRVMSDVGRAHNDYFPRPVQEEMLRRGLEALAEDGRGYVGMLTIDRETAAAQAFFRSDTQLLVHYGGFDPKFAKYSPLLILQSEIYRREIERGTRELNLLFGSAQWQKRWGAESREKEQQAILLRRGVAPAVRSAIYGACREATALMRRHRVQRRLALVMHSIADLVNLLKP